MAVSTKGNMKQETISLKTEKINNPKMLVCRCKPNTLFVNGQVFGKNQVVTFFENDPVYRNSVEEWEIL